MKQLILVIASVLFCASCKEPKETEVIPMELMSRGLFTCVNTPTAVTCFGGEFPESWEGRSLPSAPIVLHRPNRKARLVGDVLICLDNGECFGVPGIGSSAIAKDILAPIVWSDWSQLTSSLNVVCGLNHAGKTQCWGPEWVNQPVGVFEHISVGDLQICGSNAEGLNCQRVRNWMNVTQETTPERPEHEEDQMDLYGIFPGFGNSCSGFGMSCAQNLARKDEVRCWYQQGKHSDYSGVKEFACTGMHVCINTGERVECNSRDRASKAFDIKISNLSMGTHHFCGIDENGLVVCHMFGNVSKIMEPLSLQSWELMSTFK